MLLADMMAELARREKTSQIIPDMEIDTYMKVNLIAAIQWCILDPFYISRQLKFECQPFLTGHLFGRVDK